jgi:hypothetical protein
MGERRIVGLNGFKQSGKDSTGDIIANEHGYKRASFADLLYESVAALFGVPRELWDRLKNDPRATVTLQWPTGLADENGDPYMQEVKLTCRQFMQRYGTQSHRDVFGADFWIEQCVKYLDPDVDYVFTDARFDNELAAIRALGGVNFRIEREGTGQDGDTHESEALPDPTLIDAVIHNDGTLSDLANEVYVLLSSR